MKKNDVLLINPYPYYARGINESTIEPPLGLLYMAGVLKKVGISVKLADENVLQTPQSVTLERISLSDPKIIGISSNIVTYRALNELAHSIRLRFPNKIIVAGGPFPTLFPERVLKQTGIDYVVIGEGEETFKELSLNILGKSNIARDQINGIAYLSDTGEMIRTIPRERIKDINLLPFPDYHMLPNLLRYRTRARKKPVAPLLTSRGCPYQCIYCSKDVFKSRIIYRSPENILEEIVYLQNYFGVKQVDIIDDNFTMDMKRAENLLDLLIHNKIKIFINLQSGIRVDKISKPIIEKMKTAGVCKIGFGVESGDENMLKFIRKGINLSQVLKANKWAKSCGIVSYGFFMIGLPGETKETLRKTMDFAKQMNPTFANFVITIPFPGTKLYEIIKNEGRFLVSLEEGINNGFYAAKVYFTMDGMVSPKVIQDMYKKSYREFYFNFTKVLDVILSIGSIEELKWVVSTALNTLKSFYSK